MSPLKPTEDAITFDATGVSIDGVVGIQKKAKKLLTKDDSLVILINNEKSRSENFSPVRLLGCLAPTCQIPSRDVMLGLYIKFLFSLKK